MRSWGWALVVAGCHHSAGSPPAPDVTPIPAQPVTCPAFPVGPLCGPAGAPCQVVTREPITNPWSRSLSLLVDCSDQPAILYGYSQTATQGAVGMRGAGGWTTVAMPVDSYLGAGGFDPSGTLHVLAPSQQSPYQLSYLTFAGGAWSAPSLVSDHYSVFRSGVAAATDAVYALAPDDVGGLHFGRYDGAWMFTPLDSDAATNGTIAIAPSGNPELVYWGTGLTSTWSLVHRQVPAPAETIDTISNVLIAEDIALAVGDGSARVLFDTATLGFESDPGTSELDYAVRDATGAWTMTTVENDVHSPRCFMAYQSGEPCSEHDIVHVPLAVIASASGDIRLVYRVTDSTYNMVSDCPSPQQQCAWTVTSSQLNTTLVVAWPENAGGFTSATVFTGEVTQAVPDSQGRIHAIVGGDPLEYLVLQ